MPFGGSLYSGMGGQFGRNNQWARNPQLKEGDILVVRSGAYTGDSAIIRKEVEGSIAGYDMVLTVNKANPEFVAYSLLGKHILEGQIYLSKLRAAQPHLNAEELGECIAVFPSFEEQEKIVAYLNNTLSHLDEIVSETSNAIDRLQEFRVSIVSSAVTGKIDVRELK